MALYEKVDIESGGPFHYVGRFITRVDEPQYYDAGFREVKEDDTWYCLYCDADGHWFVIPVGKKEEADEYFEAVYKYWAPFSDKNELELPEEPDWLIPVDGWHVIHFREYREEE